jgi:DNA-binding MarR family transcriptional regulator
LESDPGKLDAMKPPTGIALLLTQLGGHVSARFTEVLSPLDLRPSHVGLLRLIAADPGMSQLRLAERVGIVPSRIVKLLDELEQRGLIERRRSPTDRRHHELHLAPAAAERLADVRRVVAQHDAIIVEPLTASERDTLYELLNKLAAAHGVGPDTPPRYRLAP